MKRILQIFTVTVVALLIFAVGLVPASAQTEQQMADAFISAVENIGNATTIYDIQDAVEYAKSQGVYFDDESYPGVTEALATLAERETYVNTMMLACESFVDYVSTASELYHASGSYLASGSYPQIRSALDGAKEYRNSLNLTYEGIDAMISEYEYIVRMLEAPEKASANYVGYAEKMEAAQTYADKKKNYDEAQKLLETIIPDYPGVAAATASYEEILEYFDERESEANRFKAAVAAIGISGNGIHADISAAIIALEDVDTTVSGVKSSLTAFNSQLNEISAIISAANSAQEAIVKAVMPTAQSAAALPAVIGCGKKRVEYL